MLSFNIFETQNKKKYIYRKPILQLVLDPNIGSIF